MHLERQAGPRSQDGGLCALQRGLGFSPEVVVGARQEGFKQTRGTEARELRAFRWGRRTRVP